VFDLEIVVLDLVTNGARREGPPDLHVAVVGDGDELLVGDLGDLVDA
jgi:hypothetical protein